MPLRPWYKVTSSANKEFDLLKKRGWWVINLLPCPQPGQLQMCVCVFTHREELAIAGNSPRLSLGTRESCRWHSLPQGHTAPCPQQPNSHISEFETSASLESCTSLHPSPSRPMPIGISSPPSCQPWWVLELPLHVTWAGKSREPGFSLLNIYPPPQRAPKKRAAGGVSEAPRPHKTYFIFLRKWTIFSSFVFIWYPEVPGFPGIYMKNSSYSSHSFHTHSSCQQTTAIWGQPVGVEWTWLSNP